ncbi:hypothetical protein Aph02nite_40400 [Actinoplanes philippinensis]|uniref:Uncharacterized protein n=1 Tax=Actinoplanes philippinensis TaxID=35752 RepID=A0A1I2GTN1_9ACTN|nr:hypothetical protein Aph02nite_40400 [Actinoplanes philippinensis]SFF20822.1 hypothetical protein SAMN05421541_107171 [Actinoplanes philippinensis]
MDLTAVTQAGAAYGLAVHSDHFAVAAWRRARLRSLGVKPAGEDGGLQCRMETDNNRHLVVPAGTPLLEPSRVRARSSRSCSQSEITANEDAPAMTAQTATASTADSG